MQKQAQGTTDRAGENAGADGQRAETPRAAVERAAPKDNLLFLLDMEGVLAQAGRILAELQLFAARFPADDIVVIAGFFTDEINGFGLFLVSFSSHDSTCFCK